MLQPFWLWCPVLKEKLPEAFMQLLSELKIILENLTAKVWANVDNSIKNCDFSK